MSFLKQFQQYDWYSVQHSIHQKTAQDVERALRHPGHGGLEDFMALISPAAEPYLEDMAQLSNYLTRRRFGNVMQLYVPMYLSNECKNICTYCGFSLDNPMRRTTLTDEEILQEIQAIKAMGFDHLLLVTGEDQRYVHQDFFKRVMRLIRGQFSHMSMEVQPLKQEEYEELIALGLNAVLVYQETYGPLYGHYHPKGRKSNFQWRLETPDRLGRAGIQKIGIGSLIGLDDWRADAWFTALHLQYLNKTYWRSKYSISFPRLRPAKGVQPPKVVMSDPELIQLICAYRILDEDVELSLSTREEAWFRDHAVHVGITSISAGSRTEPGGYSLQQEALEQFEIEDNRTPAEVAAMLQQQGFEPVWKDWDANYA